MIKKLVQTSLAVGLAVSLSGCVKLSMDFTIDKQDRVSGVAIVAVADSLSELMDETPSPSESPSETTDDLFDKSTPNLKVTKYTEGGFTGEKYEFTDTPLSALKTTDKDTGAFSLERVGDNIVASGNFEMSSDEEADDQMSAEMMEMMFAGADLHVTITFPGEVTETNGVLAADKQTVTWKLDPGAKNEISAKAYSPLSSPSPFHWFTTQTGIAVSSIVGLVALLVGVLAISSKRKESSEASTLVNDFE